MSLLNRQNRGLGKGRALITSFAQQHGLPESMHGRKMRRLIDLVKDRSQQLIAIDLLVKGIKQLSDIFSTADVAPRTHRLCFDTFHDTSRLFAFGEFAEISDFDSARN